LKSLSYFDMIHSIRPHFHVNCIAPRSVLKPPSSANYPFNFDPNSYTIMHFLHMAKDHQFYGALTVIEKAELTVWVGKPIAGGVYTVVSPTVLVAITL